MGVRRRGFGRILLTGGAGFIGCNFARHVLRERPDVHLTSLDALTCSGDGENLADLEDEPRHRFVHGDICDRELVDALVAECDAVVHMAAETHVDRSIADAGPFIRSNVMGTQTLLDAVRARAAAGGPAPRFLYVSTDEVYGSLPLRSPPPEGAARSRGADGTGAGPDAEEGGGTRFTEESPLAPNNPYAASKAAGDCLVRAYRRTFGLDVVTTRCSNNLGPYQLPEKVIPRFVTNLLEGRALPLYGDGRHVRDWLHVEDHCEAVLTVLEGGRSGEVYNVGADNERSNLELARAILRIMGRGEEMIRRVEDRPGHDLRYAIDARKIERELGWRPTRSAWPAALERTVDWYRKNENWWGRLKCVA